MRNHVYLEFDGVFQCINCGGHVPDSQGGDCPTELNNELHSPHYWYVAHESVDTTTASRIRCKKCEQPYHTTAPFCSGFFRPITDPKEWEALFKKYLRWCQHQDSLPIPDHRDYKGAARPIRRLEWPTFTPAEVATIRKLVNES